MVEFIALALFLYNMGAINGSFWSQVIEIVHEFRAIWNDIICAEVPL